MNPDEFRRWVEQMFATKGNLSGKGVWVPTPTPIGGGTTPSSGYEWREWRAKTMQARRPPTPEPDVKDIPDIAGAIIGWRWWQLLRGVLQSPSMGILWPGREPLEASCNRGHRGKVVPNMGCRCGIYSVAANNHSELRSYEQAGGVLGSVALWGRVVRGAKGWRAQYAYPQDLFLIQDLWYGVPERQVLAVARNLEEAYGVACHTVTRNMMDKIRATYPTEI